MQEQQVRRPAPALDHPKFAVHRHSLSPHFGVPAPRTPRFVNQQGLPAVADVLRKAGFTASSVVRAPDSRITTTSASSQRSIWVTVMTLLRDGAPSISVDANLSAPYADDHRSPY